MIYVTADLHGIHPQEFRSMLERTGFGEDDFLFVLGDVIDRGRHGIDLLLWLMEQTNIQFIRGNHEDMMLSCAFVTQDLTQENLDALGEDELKRLAHWRANGGKPTMEGLHRLLKQDPERVALLLEYLQDAPHYEELKVAGRQYILCHSGIRDFDPDAPIETCTPFQLTWCRPELEQRFYEGKRMIFGHTPTLLYGDAYKGRAVRTDTWTNIDTGAAYGLKPMLLRLEDEKEFYFDEI